MKILECQLTKEGDYVIPISFSREDRDKRKEKMYRETENNEILRQINRMLTAVHKNCD